MHHSTFRRGLSNVCLLLALTLLIPVLPACAQTGPSRYSAMIYDVFDTVITLIGYADSQETFERVFHDMADQFSHYNQLFDNYHAYEGVANLYTLNHEAMNAPVQVDRELFDMLKWCKEKQLTLSEDTVNIAMGAVLSIWHEYREAGIEDLGKAQLPPMHELEAAAQHTSIDDLILDEEALTVYYRDPDLRLDLGAVAKGYTAQLVAERLYESDMPSFILNAGGNVVTGRQPLDGRENWGVGIQDPDGNAQVEVLYLREKSVVTSGDYQRYYVVDGQRYSHLISPETLMPAAWFRSVTVVAEDSGFCDFLSTKLFLMPYEEGRAFVDGLDGVEAYWIMPDLTVRMTEGMKRYARSAGATSMTK
ncbi:MAG: FAD:protein FMN transferase [Clostridia bacterium]|nr:FAD:protein FMN transferase [Clostridia bacterium]